jgi:hypothetical protein
MLMSAKSRSKAGRARFGLQLIGVAAVLIQHPHVFQVLLANRNDTDTPGLVTKFVP